jgi:2,3-bisphosphoglycerate-dependent phosphoglycerate mutase
MTDTPLTEDGIEEARIAGRLLKSEGGTVGEVDVVYTSLLRRSIKTVNLVLEELGTEWTPVVKDWRLNERSYGALVGKNKKECVAEFGKDQVKRWRRSWDEPPPPMSPTHPHWPGHESRYRQLGIDVERIPLSESLKDVTKRTSEFWDNVIVPQLKLGKRLMIVGHENNLRSLIKRLDGISNDDILHVELPRAIPLVFHLDRTTLRPIKLTGHAEYLSGRYICDPAKLEAISHMDQKQVYDLSQKETLETKGNSAVLKHARIE